MTYNPRINNLDGNVVQVSGTLSTKLSRVKGSIVKVTGSTQLDVTNYAVLADASSNNLTLTLPPASTVPGLNYKIKKIDSDKQPVYDYDPSTFKQRQILSGSFATGSSDLFGASVALNAIGDVVLIGAYWDETGSNSNLNMGLSYIFRSGSTGWVEEAILSGSLATGSGDRFGNSVALNSVGNIALVGAYQDETGSNGTPSAMGLSYIFRSSSTGWREEVILSGSLATGSFDYFGYSVALNALGDIALVGAYADETGSNGEPASMGLSYIFRSSSSGWVEEKILSGSLATGSADNFGYSVALNSVGNIALVGAYQDETGSINNTGLAYIFISSSVGWREEAILSGSLSKLYSSTFGSSVAINASGNIVLIGDESAKRNPNIVTRTGLAYIFISSSTGWYEEAVLSGTVTAQDDYFGWSVALNDVGDIALVGAVQDELGPSNQGLVYVFSKQPTGWKQIAGLTGSVASINDYSAGSVALNASGNIMLFGSEGAGTNNSGLAYIFESSISQLDSNVGLIELKGSPIPETYDFINYKEKIILTGSLSLGDQFGDSVALNALGDIALIGARLDETGSDGTPSSMGLSYIFRSSSIGWVEEKILSGSLAIQGSDNFGWSVALNAAGNIALVGAYADETGSDGTPNAMGLSYIFRSSSTGWREEAILSGSLATGSFDYFGASVALNASGNIALVGAVQDETGSNGQPDAMGLSYIFRSGSTGWVEEAILSGSLAIQGSDQFGYSVALNALGDIALVGAVQDETGSNGLSSGTAYIFRSGSTGWVEEVILSGSLATGSGDDFGYSVALNALGDIALVGAYWDETGSDGTPNGMGLSYIFRSSSTGWVEEAILSGSLATGSSDHFGASVALNASGNIALVGAYQDELSDSSVSMGLAYVFVSGSTGWKQQAVLNGSLSKLTNNNFGLSIALNSIGNICLIGDTNDNCYIFETDPFYEPIDNTSSVKITTQYETVEVISNGSGSWKLF